MGKLKEFISTLRDFSRVLPTLLTFRPPTDDQTASMGLILQSTADKYPSHTAILFEGGEISWSELNQLANRYANLLKSLGVRRGDAVSVLMENRINMIALMLGITKMGAVASLINTSLRGKQLVHCLTTTDSLKCVFGQELSDAIYEVKADLPFKLADCVWIRDEGRADNSEPAPNWAIDGLSLLSKHSDANLPETATIKAGEKALYIFTSGTTGLPKAAIIYHRRYVSGCTPFGKLGLRAKPGDRIYLCLPLYHMTGLLTGFGSALVTGATVFVRRRFSASRFWPEVKEHKTNMFVYIGELCRFLAMQPERPEEKNNPITTMVGNGLRPDVWDVFRDRFEVGRIFEFYGSSEGNATFLNLLNKEKTIGTTNASLMLAKYDIVADELVRDDKGNLIEVEKGEPGLLLAEISQKYNFDGYINKEASNSKILESVKRPGDRWFNTGDMIKQIDVGVAFGLPHFQFVDRVGDTFRWRGENVSTNEVAEILSQFDSVETANVYGVEVPGAEGRAGMVSFSLTENSEFDIRSFAAFAQKELPTFARPVFLRLQQRAETTGTFKLQKGRLREQAYHLDQVSDPLFVLMSRTGQYVPLDSDIYKQVSGGNFGF